MKTRIGRIIQAVWNDKTKSIDFIIEFQPSGIKIRGSCPSGKISSDKFISPGKLKEKISEFKRLSVFDSTGKFDPEMLSPEDIRNLKIEISLSGGGIKILPPNQNLDENFFLSRILR
jgi:hypothetical protein